MDVEVTKPNSPWTASERVKWYKQMKRIKRLEQKRNSKQKYKDDYNERRRKVNKELSENSKSIQKQKNRLKQKAQRERNREYVRKYRERKEISKQSISIDDLNDSFENKMSKSRSLKKMKDALPKTPTKRAAVISSYFTSKHASNSPTVVALQTMNIINTKEQKEMIDIGSSLLSDMKSALDHCKTQRNDDARKTVTVISSVVSGEKIEKHGLRSKVARKLGIPGKTLESGKRKRTQIMKSEKSSWTFTSRKTRSDALSETNKKTVYDFWLSPLISRPSGNKKDIKRVRIRPKVYSSHMAHVLNVTQTEAYYEFQRSHPEIEISQRLFERLKPYFVRAAKQQDRSTCCCRYHVEMKSLFKNCMIFRKSVLDNRTREEVDVENQTEYKVFDSLTELADVTLCPKDCQDSVHKMDCLNRTCGYCGVQNFALLPEEIDKSNTAPDVKWDRYEYVDFKSKGSVRRKLILVQKVTKPGDMFTYFTEILQTFSGTQLSG